jgi:hypothetical protein
MKNRSIPMTIRASTLALTMLPCLRHAFQNAQHATQPAANPNWPYFLAFAEREFEAEN